MKKKLIWICIFLLSVIGFFAYRLMHPSLHMHFVYSLSLLTDEQINYMKAHPNVTQIRPTGKELYMKHISLVLRVRNEGEIYTGGPLLFRVEGTEHWHEIQVAEIAPKSAKNGMSVQEYIIPLGIQNFSQSDKPIHINVDAFKMWVANRSGGHSKKHYFRPNFKYECYLFSDGQIERVGEVAF